MSISFDTSVNIRNIAEEEVRKAINDLPRKEWENKYVELNCKRDGSDNPTIIHIADIAVIQAEGALAGNTKIYLRGSGKIIQVSENFSEVRKKIFGKLKDTDNTDNDAELNKKKPFKKWPIGYYKGFNVFMEKATGNSFGIVDISEDIYICIPVKPISFEEFGPSDGMVKRIPKEDIEM